MAMNKILENFAILVFKVSQNSSKGIERNHENL
jgi:hypothetical protein